MENMFIKQLGEGHKVQRLYIHWDITTVCEYKCSYCYATEQYKDSWMRPGNWTKQLEVIEELSKAKLPIFLGLLGGEPTSHHRYHKLIKLIEEKVLTHKDSRLYITTNGSKQNFFEDCQKSNSKMYTLFSYHVEYADDESDKTFLKNILIMQNKGYRIKVNVMLHPKKEYWKRIQRMIMMLDRYDNIEVHPHYIYIDQHKNVRYSKEFYKEFEYLKERDYKEFIFIDKDRKEFYKTDTEIFESKINMFKDWKCWNNNYEIGLDCRVGQLCFDTEKHPIKKYFQNIDSIEPKRCPFDYCSCDGLLKIKKEK